MVNNEILCYNIINQSSQHTLGSVMNLNFNPTHRREVTCGNRRWCGYHDVQKYRGLTRETARKKKVTVLRVTRMHFGRHLIDRVVWNDPPVQRRIGRYHISPTVSKGSHRTRWQSVSGRTGELLDTWKCAERHDRCYIASSRGKSGNPPSLLDYICISRNLLHQCGFQLNFSQIYAVHFSDSRKRGSVYVQYIDFENIQNKLQT